MPEAGSLASPAAAAAAGMSHSSSALAGDGVSVWSNGAHRAVEIEVESESGADRVPLVECTSAARKRLANFKEAVELDLADM